MKLPRLLHLPLLLFLYGCQAPEKEAGHPPPADGTPPMIRITQQSFGLMTMPRAELIAEVRGDTPASKKLIDDLWERHHRSFPKGWMNYGPDSGCTQIEFVHRDGKFTAASWHTVEQTEPSLFVSHHGVESLGTRTRAQALAAEPESYRHCRESLDAIYDAVTKFRKR